MISAERLVDPSTGPEEAAKLARAIQDKPGISDYLIEEDKWSCIWEELILNKKGAKTFLDRKDIDPDEYNFSEEMLDEMIHEVDRLINKYSNAEWQVKPTAQDLVSALQEHKVALLEELIEVQSGERVLKINDFLGPKTRRKMILEMEMQQTHLQGSSVSAEVELRDLKGDRDFEDFFEKLEERIHEGTFKRKREGLIDEERRRNRLVL